ncbi:MAG: carotenoid synthesis regulator CarF [Myxococcales bacterium]|jgi:ubiquitin-conjugating enzyme E2 variant|nr:carotenoid synthesis regulator CarF [Myxococcales bacterium]
MEPGTRRKDSKELAEGYSWTHRVYELGGITLAIGAATWLCVRLAHAAPLSGWFVPLAALCGILAADFFSGLIHWGFDTWGAVDTPILGKLAIRTFREHHVDEKAITRHDFVETNGHNMALSGPMYLSGVYALSGPPSLGMTFVGMTALAAGFFIGITSQIHKWAHMEQPPAPIRLLQRARLLLTAEHHALHHTAPYDRAYCITVGWLNGPLRAVRFFETLERIITAVTGAVPREDDIGKDAALATLEEQEVVLAPPPKEAKVKIDP